MKINEVSIWRKSEINGFFGLLTNIITNLLVLTSLLIYTLGFPTDLVFKRILPGTGLGILVACLFYSYNAYKLAKRTGRNDVTALPTGLSVPHMFLIVYMVILPIKIKTGDCMLAWEAGMVWCLIEGLIEVVGAFVGKWVRKYIPRAALLGSLAGVSITAIMANSAIHAMEITYIAIACLGVIMLGFLGKKKMPFNIPASVVVILLGTLLGWISGFMSSEVLATSISSVSVNIPRISVPELLKGFKVAAPFLASALPLGINNFMETIENLESADVAGDHYDSFSIMMADGVTSIIGACFGSVVPTAVYIGHTGWKSMGARIGYSGLCGIVTFVFVLFGVESILLSVIPVEALLPILVYIGILIGTQAFDSVPKSHFPAVIIGFIPWLADWGITFVNNAVSAAGINAADVSLSAFSNAGIYYSGLSNLSNGAIIISVLWTTMVVFIIERKEKQTVIIAIAGAILSFFGIIHSASIGIMQNIGAMIGYLIVATVCLIFTKVGYEEDRNEKMEAIKKEEE